jgi:signal peptidase I
LVGGILVKKEKTLSLFTNLAKTIFSFIFLLLFINTYFISITSVSGESMFPTFTTGDNVMFSRLSTYAPQKYERGDVIVCRFGMKEYSTENNEYVQNNTSTYIKRIIAIEGDTIEIADGKVFVNEKDVTKEYWGDVEVKDTLLRLKVPKGHVFVIGDNINNSIDSRVVNCLPYSNILGKVVYKIQYKDIFGREYGNLRFPSFEKM